MTVGLIDYGGGNLLSATNALFRAGAEVVVSNDYRELLYCSHLVLHGVGAFSATMEGLENSLGLDNLSSLMNSGKPFLGICVGMQVLAEIGFENGEHSGLGVVRGRVEKLNLAPSLPHMGWNTLELKDKGCPILRNIAEEDHFYFVHSYSIVEGSSSETAALTNHGQKFVSVVQKESVFGVQFHPEKSGNPGELVLRNFISL